MPKEQIKTSVSIVHIDEDAIVDWQYNSGAVVTITEAQEEIDLITPMIHRNGGQCRLLIDIREIGSISREARDLFASDETSNLGSVAGLALLVDSVFSKVIGNFYMTINSPPHPTRLFTDKDSAKDWLHELPLSESHTESVV